MLKSKIVESALYSENSPAELKQLVSSMSPDELHSFSSEYNWDDGVDALQWVVERDDCDLGTALLIFWDGEPETLWKAEVEEAPEWQMDLISLLRFVQDRILQGNYRRRRIRFDPLGRAIPNRLQLELLKRRGIPKVLLKPTPGEACP